MAPILETAVFEFGVRCQGSLAVREGLWAVHEGVGGLLEMHCVLLFMD